MDVIVVVVLLISSNFQDNWIHDFLYKYKLDLGKLIIAKFGILMWFKLEKGDCYNCQI